MAIPKRIPERSPSVGSAKRNVGGGVGGKPNSKAATVVPKLALASEISATDYRHRCWRTAPAGEKIVHNDRPFVFDKNSRTAYEFVKGEWHLLTNREIYRKLAATVGL